MLVSERPLRGRPGQVMTNPVGYVNHYTGLNNVANAELVWSGRSGLSGCLDVPRSLAHVTFSVEFMVVLVGW